MSAAPKVRERVIYRGRVQGVGFRMTARVIAQGFAVTGWVRNQDDGSVLLEVQGDSAQVRAFRESLALRRQRYITDEVGQPCPCVANEAGFAIRPSSG